MWQVAVLLHALAALTLLAVIPVPDPDPSDHHALAIVAGLYALAAVLLAIAGPRPLILAAVPFSGVFSVSALVAITTPVGATPFFYLWPLLCSAYFTSRRMLLLTLGLMTVTYGAALALYVEPGTRMMLFVGGVLSVSLAALLVNQLKLRLDRTVARLHETAATDPLTGILNRRAFETAFDRELGRAHRAGAPLTLVVLDVDHFKRVNDQLGHAAGDEALRRVTQVLVAEARATDVVARLGGEEFGVLVLGADLADAHRYVDRVAVALSSAGEAEVPLSVSAGAASLGAGFRTREELLVAADAALYRAKGAGRGRIAIAGGDVAVLGDAVGAAAVAPAACAR